jgi:NOL1/NOP2/fmu family ribosome biogenesis protein
MGEGDDPGGATTNDGERFDRLPATGDERTVEGRPTREEVLEWWDERFGVPPGTFEAHSFWERGRGKIWAFRGGAESPVAIEGLGMTFLRTRQEHWKPTLSAVQRFGGQATRNVVHLTREEAAEFLAGRDQELAWDGDWGYLVVTHDLAGEPRPLGVGLYVYGELRSQVPKGRQRELTGSRRGEDDRAGSED